MKLILLNSEKVDFKASHDLSLVIPKKMKGKVINYGQGEGQVEIEGIVFGFYVGDDKKYYFSFEEGVMEWERVKVLVDAILNKIQKEFGKDIKLLAKGPLTNEADI
jgi:hypothetical protein